MKDIKATNLKLKRKGRRHCGHCGEDKDISEFYEGFGWCKDCYRTEYQNKKGGSVPMQDCKFIKLAELAILLGISRVTCLEWLKGGKIPYKQMGEGSDTILIPKKFVDDLEKEAYANVKSK